MTTTLGPIVTSLKTYKLTRKEQQILNHHNIGGVILFARNFENQQQLIDLVVAIRKINPHLIIMVDHEGGRVWRFRGKEFSNPGPMQQLGKLYDYDPTAALNKAYAYGKMIAEELLTCNIDLNLAPVLDLDHAGTSSVIGDRAFHSEPDVVALIAAKFIQGQTDLGMQAIGKHFPGHGAIQADTHWSTAIDLRTKEQIYTHDLLPFQKLINGDLKLGLNPGILPGIMPAHIIYPQIDPENPAGFSKIWLQHILRDELKFQGVIISDCLSMAAAQQFRINYADFNQMIHTHNLHGSEQQLKNLFLTKQALDAGCDLIIFNELYDQDLEYLLNHIDLIDPFLGPEKLPRSIRISKLLTAKPINYN